jgi:hypothetical protein
MKILISENKRVNYVFKEDFPDVLVLIASKIMDKIMHAAALKHTRNGCLLMLVAEFGVSPYEAHRILENDIEHFEDGIIEVFGKDIRMP